MKWKDAAMESLHRVAYREDEEGEHRIDIDGGYEIHNRETDEVYDVGTSRANRYSDWRPL